MSLELKGVSLSVDGETHIYETSIALQPTGFNILLGTTLAGKTSLMRLMAGLVEPSSGEIWFNDQNVTGVPVQKRNVSMVYQQFINYPNFNVFDNIASPLKLAGLKADEIKKRVEPVAELLRLGPFLSRKPAELSGGQQQRCAMARALVKDSDLVLLDEPLANLDYKLREELREELPKLFSARERTVVYATTEPSEALLLDGYTAAMYEGRVTQYGPTGDIYRSPRDALTAGVFSDPPMNLVGVKKEGDQFKLPDGLSWQISAGYRNVPDGDYQFGIRSHHVRPHYSASSSDVHAVHGSVQVSEIAGSESIVHFDMLGQPWVSIDHGVHDYSVGQKATFSVEMEHSMLFSLGGDLVATAGQGL